MPITGSQEKGNKYSGKVITVSMNNGAGTAGMRASRILTCIFILAWLAASFVGAYFHIFFAPGQPPLSIALFVVVPIALGEFSYLLSSAFRAFARSISLRWLTLAHTWRFVGLGFILSWFPLRLLPAGFGIPEGAGDIAAAALAIPLSSAIHKGTARRRYFVAWNVFSLIDLVSAITMGVLFSPSNFGILANGGLTTELMVTFPANLIPTFLVPLFILSHLLALARRKEIQV
jgi:hypothetical protein